MYRNMWEETVAVSLKWEVINEKVVSELDQCSTALHCNRWCSSTSGSKQVINWTINLNREPCKRFAISLRFINAEILHQITKFNRFLLFAEISTHFQLKILCFLQLLWIYHFLLILCRVHVYYCYFVVYFSFKFQTNALNSNTPRHSCCVMYGNSIKFSYSIHIHVWWCHMALNVEL